MNPNDLIPQLESFALSIAIGLLMGLERERRPSAGAGLRTFALVALLGSLAALLAERGAGPWILVVGFAAVAAMIIAAHLRQPDPEDPGTTSVVALLVCYCLGALVWFGYPRIAVMLGIASTVLLYLKTELRGIASRLTPADYASMLQFGVLSLVILPVLPNRDFGPYHAFNPYQIWLMVVLIAGMSLAGYAALRLVGPRSGAPLIGLFGGLVSSTATTLVFARDARRNPGMTTTATVVILLANVIMMLRVAGIVGVLAPGLLPGTLITLAGGLVPATAVAAYGWAKLRRAESSPMPQVRNPTELRAALGFGLMYGIVLFLSAWLSDIAGETGIYGVALVSGLTDVDAITLSSLRLFAMTQLAGETAITAIGLAVVANLVFKFGLSAAIAGGGLARGVLPGMVMAAIGIGVSMVWRFH